MIRFFKINNNNSSYLDLCKYSSLLGKNSNYVQAAGGNTSLKENGFMYVKGSGKLLSRASKENIFVKVKTETYKQIHKSKNIEEEEKLFYKKSILRPSIETALHALMPFNAVIHTHPTDIIALSLLENGTKKIADLLKDISWEWVPYVRPGKDLASKVESILNKKKVHLLILANHGIVVGGENLKEAFNLHKKIVNLLYVKKRKVYKNDLNEVHSLVEKIPNSSLPKDLIIHNLAFDKWSFSLLNKPPYCPDHIIFCGKENPIFYGKNHNWEYIRKKYSYAIIENIGVIIFNQSNALEAMLKAQAEIFLKIPEDSSVRMLSSNECDFLHNWEAEKYRKKINQI